MATPVVTPPRELYLSVRDLRQVAYAAFATLLALHLGSIGLRQLDFPIQGVLKLFDFNAESNLPTLFSVLLLLSASALSAAAARQVQQHRWSWILLSVAFAFVAVDEFAVLHERLVLPVRELLGGVTGVLFFAWIVPYAVAVLALGVLLWRWLFALPIATRRGFVVAAVLYLSGAVGMEMLSGWYVSGLEMEGVWRTPDDLLYSALTTVEESCEMLGAIVFVVTALRYLRDELGVPGLRIQ